MLPIPSDAHWMPLAAIIQLPTMWLMGQRLGLGDPVRDRRLARGSADLASRPRDRLLAAHCPCRRHRGRRAGSRNHLHGQPDNLALYQPSAWPPSG